jgi:hypothetical protein
MISLPCPLRFSLCLAIINLFTSTFNGDEGRPAGRLMVTRRCLSSGKLLAGFLVMSSCLAEISICLQMVFNAIPLGGSFSWYGDGKWLGSLPGWYTSMSYVTSSH